MKKRFLVALFVVIIACLFSVVAYASDEVTLLDGTKEDFTTVFNVNSKSEVTGFKSGYDKNSVTDVIFPDEIVGLESNFLFSSSTTINTLTFGATDTFFISGDNIFSDCSVKKITFDPNCVVELRKGSFSGCTSLTEITFPKFKVLTGGAFKGCSKMVATNQLILVEGLKEIGGHAFNGCLGLKGTLVFPSTLEKIYEYSFENTGFEYFDLSKCANLTSVGGGYGGPFTNNDSITTLDLSGCTSLKALKGSFASDCANLTTVILPPNLETIPHKAFAHCYKLQSIVFPASLTYVADEAFHSARRGQDVMTFTVYIQSNVQFHATYPFRDSGAKIEFVLIGEGVTVESFKAANTYSAITNATIVDYLDPASPGTYKVGQAMSNHTIVANYCKSLALTGEHLSDDNPCVIVCNNCGIASVKENPQHNESIVIEYANGYENAGAKLTVCTNKGCPHKVTEEMKALFTVLGYSAPENGVGGIAVGYTVDKQAVNDFEEITNTTVRYGVFAVSMERLGTNDVFDKNGVAAQGVLHAEILNHDFIAFEIKVYGFSEVQKDIKFAIGAYVIADGEYSYMQFGTPNEGSKYHFISYNEII